MAFLMHSSMLFGAKVIYIEYYPTGEKRIEMTQISQNLVRFDMFYPSGALQETGLFKGGRVHGKWVTFAATGEELAVAYFHKSKKLGSWVMVDQWQHTTLNLIYVDNRPHYYRNYNEAGLMIGSGFAMR